MLKQDEPKVALKARRKPKAPNPLSVKRKKTVPEPKKVVQIGIKKRSHRGKRRTKTVEESST